MIGSQLAKYWESYCELWFCLQVDRMYFSQSTEQVPLTLLMILSRLPGGGAACFFRRDWGKGSMARLTAFPDVCGVF